MRKKELRARVRGASESSLLDEEAEVDSDGDDKVKVRGDFGDTADELSRIQPQYMEYIVGDAEEERFSTF